MQKHLSILEKTKIIVKLSFGNNPTSMIYYKINCSGETIIGSKHYKTIINQYQIDQNNIYNKKILIPFNHTNYIIKQVRAKTYNFPQQNTIKSYKQIIFLQIDRVKKYKL
ncbi:hypothetical protein CV664_04335 [Borreliella burgdorferi]|nr:hypothetical protein CV664_04335 [Borreliella burgdorferi]